MKIQISSVPPERQKPIPASLKGIPFGSQTTDHMFLMEWHQGQGWHHARIEAYQAISLMPSALVFHYGQEAFEGLKAYHTVGGKNVLFRPQKNIERLNATARRLCLPELDPAMALKAVKQLVSQEQHWIPKEEGSSLYIRPALIATEAALGLKVSKEYLFFIIVCPVGAYFPEGFNPVKIRVCEEYVRAVPGGVGNVKTGGNYAAANLAEKEAKEAGFTQVLWLDGVERKYVEEVGSMNIFFVIQGELITPQLTGTILPGVTRDSVLQLARHQKMMVSERRISIDEVVQSIENGTLTEAFGTGTAAVISPIGLLSYQGKDFTIGAGKTGPIAKRIFDEMVGIQYGKSPDFFQWIEPVE